MQIENTEQRWGGPQQIMHWAIVALVVTQLIVGFRLLELNPRDSAWADLVPVHSTTGILIFLIMSVRLWWRRAHPVPKLPDTLSPQQKAMATATHYTLYAILLSMPVIGYMLINSHGQTVPFFGWELPQIIREDPTLQYALQRLHFASALGLLAVLVLHIGAALRHAWSLRDGVMERMAPLLYSEHNR